MRFIKSSEAVRVVESKKALNFVATFTKTVIKETGVETQRGHIVPLSKEELDGIGVMSSSPKRLIKVS